MENTQDNLPGAEGNHEKTEHEVNHPSDQNKTQPEEAENTTEEKEARPGAGNAETEATSKDEESVSEDNEAIEQEKPAAEQPEETPDSNKAAKAIEEESAEAKKEGEPLAAGPNMQAIKTDVEESQEQEVSDEELEGEDTTEEVQGEEDEHADEHPDELELPDYAEYQPEKLVQEAEKLLKSQPAQKLKDHFDAIRKSLLKQLNEERQEKLEQFIEEGGVEMDFEYIQPIREKFRGIFKDYRSQRKKYYDDLKERLDNNLKIKKGLIEELKEIVTKEESIGDKFKDFNKVIQEWRNTGPVPRAESGNIWRTYHHHVENFYEDIKINKELRDLDYKKNREIKESLLKKAEQLVPAENVPQAFRDLQKLHKEWKHTGPVEPENREPLWEKFSDITKTIHDKREEYYEKLREKRGELIEIKQKLVDKLKETPTDFKRHNEWQKAIKEVRAIADDFKKIGRLNHPDNDKVWEEYREVLRHFNRQKNQFYKELKQDHQENLEKKQALLKRAEELKDSEDWRDTTNELKRIQADWKNIGHVPKKESDKIWKRFRAACNHFFDRLTEHNKQRDKKFEGNLEDKQKLLDELKALETDPKDRKGTVAKIKDIISRWRDSGPVPRGKGKIEKAFNSALDDKFQAIDMDREESMRIRFENKMKNLAEGGGDQKLKSERRSVSQKLEEARRELAQLETNMSFFSSSDPKSPIVKEAQQKINKQEEAIKRLEEQHKMLNVKIRAINKPEEKEPSENSDSGDSEQNQ